MDGILFHGTVCVLKVLARKLTRAFMGVHWSYRTESLTAIYVEEKVPDDQGRLAQVLKVDLLQSVGHFSSRRFFNRV